MSDSATGQGPSSYANKTGVVAMAAYNPDWALFRRQLGSIQDQTHSDFKCLISVDGNPRPVAEFVSSELGDPRFRVIGYDNRLGFYGNFERVLSNISGDPAWIALSDQDDYWYPDKLSTLLPHLDQHSLVAGQARVTDATSTRTFTESTSRRNAPLADLIAQNQVTGGQTVFRAELLTLALPFPRLNTITQVHDHWLAVCAAATGGALVVEDVVQDYVQHGGNVLGEVEGGVNLWRSFRRARDLSDRFEGGHRLRQIVASSRNLSYGWRQAMVNTLQERLPATSREFDNAYAAFSSQHTWRDSVEALIAGYRRGNIEASCLVEFAAGTPGELIRKIGARSRGGN